MKPPAGRGLNPPAPPNCRKPAPCAGFRHSWMAGDLRAPLRKIEADISTGGHPKQHRQLLMEQAVLFCRSMRVFSVEREIGLVRRQTRKVQLWTMGLTIPQESEMRRGSTATTPEGVSRGMRRVNSLALAAGAGVEQTLVPPEASTTEQASQPCFRRTK